MQWAAPRTGAADGRVLADRRTVAYAGRAQHACDALRVCSSRSVAAAVSSSSSSQRASYAALQLFYFETLVVSTSDDDDAAGSTITASGGVDAGDASARSELELLLARADAAAANLRRNVGRSLTAAHHPYAGATGGARLSWRERARRIVRANVRAADALAERESSAGEADELEDDEGEDDGERMELDGGALAVPPAASNGSGADNGDATARGLAIHQILASADAAAAVASNGHAAPGSGAPAQRSSRLLSLSHPRGATSSMHYAFTLSSRTLQQIRSRHERRRLRRQQERKRFDHRVAVGFVLTAKQRGDGSAQIRSAADASSSAGHAPSVTATNSTAVGGKSSCMHPLLRQPARDPSGQGDLGKDAFSLAYSGKTGRVTSNGRVFLQCDKFGAGDVVGCGVLLDTKTFFFTLNGRLLGMLAATDVHHFDDFVGDLAGEGDLGGGSGSGGDSDDDDDDDAAFVTDDEVGGDEEEEEEEEAEGESGFGDRRSPLFEDVLYPALSLHGAGECASATFDTFRFDLAGFARQIQKERQQALLLHEIADERDELANYRAVDKLVGDYFLHYGYRDAFETFQRRASFTNGASSSSNDTSSGGGGDVRMLDDSVVDDSDDTESGRDLGALSPTSKTLLDLRHAVRRHIYAYDTQAALEELRAALGSAFFAAANDRASRRQGKVLFYARVLCVLDTLQHRGDRPAHNGDATSGGTDGDDWNAEAAILCAQEQFSGYSQSQCREAGGSSEKQAVASVADDELEGVMSLLLYARRADVPATRAARKFLSPKFREHVADELNLLLLSRSRAQVQAASARGGSKKKEEEEGDSRSASTGSSSSPVASSASALQSFLVELNSLQAQCLRNGCRVFPGNHTVSSSRSGRRSRHRQSGRRERHSPDAGGNGNDDDDEDDDEQMRRASSSGSDMSSSSSRSENDDDDDEDDEDEEEEE